MDNFKNIIKEICQEKNIKLTILSDGWVKVLEKDGKTRYLNQFYFDNNSSAIAHILDDKYALYDTLNYFHLPVITHHILYQNTPFKEILNLFHKYQDNIVLKPNTGSRGNGVYHITKEDYLKEKLSLLLKSNYSLSLCPCYDIKMEYRVIALNGKPELIYGKIRPIVTGDGTKTIKELLINFNKSYFRKIKNLPNDILPKGKKYIYDWKFNLSKGAMSTLDIPEETKEILTKIVHDVYTKLPINFCSIDIIETTHEFKILEINSGTTIDKFTYQHEDGKKIALNVYGKAIDSLFND